MNLGRATLESRVVQRPAPTTEPPQGMCRDKASDYQAVRASLVECGFTAPIRARGEAAQASRDTASQQARRGGVERTQRWRNRLRRILVRWDKKPEHSLAFLHFACALIAFRAAGLFG
jgi:putative transposase